MTKADPAATLSNVLYPRMREELLDHLRFLQQLDARTSEGGSPRQDTDFAFDCAVDFILNDTRLHSDAAATMGWFLKSPAEVEALWKLADALDRIVPRCSQSRLHDARRNEKEWANVNHLARAALREMEASDSFGGPAQAPP